MPTWFSITFFLASLLAFPIYLHVFVIFGLVAATEPALLDHLQSAFVLVKPRFPPFLDRPIYVRRRWACPSSAPDIFTLTMVFLRIFSLHTRISHFPRISVLHVVHAMPCHAMPCLCEVVDLSLSPLRQWLTSYGSFRGPSRLRGVTFCSPPHGLVFAG